ncbi:hypothetical protein VSS37_06035 [Candidatus Thiothrix sp. Deng01]|uniref:Uncharacterized protein n=1 Tax=Candidatus Thiothrix phosphatis TaxID=3112415 RepID=A0ABU6CUL9_9GAMM|nr:hypothetical protein [Candidatus Thiothrix sp. Deng01]MEB4590532.1 hypothetical protein [Candidatus Thiothrix sp. Deng01]
MQDKHTPTSTVPAIRVNIPPLGETYGYGAKVAAMSTGELVTLSIEFCKSDKALAIMTADQAERLASALQYAAISANTRRMISENKEREVQQ